jgi:branched-chain amino acid transport system substrate-binding protein
LFHQSLGGSHDYTPHTLEDIRSHRTDHRRGRSGGPCHRTGREDQARLCKPAIGPLAAFAEADSFILSNFGATQAAANFEIIVKDSQSNPNRAAEVAKELIVDDEVDMILVASTPETTNPVATTAEAEGVPVISTVAPWQPWFIGQQGNPGRRTAGSRSTTPITSSGAWKT